MTVAAVKSAPDNPNAGHRARLRTRFLQGGTTAIADHELLELLLFYAIPQKDTKPLAKQLIQQFGSISGVFSADGAALTEIGGLKEHSIVLLKAIKTAAERMSQKAVMNMPVLSNWQQLLSYCHVAMAHVQVEQLRLLFLDKKNKLIADEIQQEGTIDHTPAYPREIIKRALNLGATALIMVHNHPSGDPTPSRADIDMTNAIRDAAKAVGIVLHDHIIIAKSDHVSFKGQGLL